MKNQTKTKKLKVLQIKKMQIKPEVAYVKLVENILKIQNTCHAL